MIPARSRRWFAAAALAATTPMLAAAQIKDVPRDNDEKDAGNSYTSPEYGMDISWEDPWKLDGTVELADELGTEMMTLEPAGAIAENLSLSTVLISHDFPSSEAFLDSREESFAVSKAERSRYALDGVHELIYDRTESTLTVLLFFNVGYGPILELYEHHAEPDARYATQSALIVNRARSFVGHFEGAQKLVTLNGAAPFTTVDNDVVIQLANDALYPDGDAPPSGDGVALGNSYTSIEFGMDITWEDPWELDRAWEDAAFGNETVFLKPSEPEEDMLGLSTVRIHERFDAKFESSGEYLDYYEDHYDPSNAGPSMISRVDLIQERTETTLTVLYLREASHGTAFEFYEHRAEPGAEFATETMLWVERIRSFKEVFMDVQEGVMLNGAAPFTTVDNDSVLQLANDVLAIGFPDDGGSGSGNRRDEDEDEEGEEVRALV